MSDDDGDKWIVVDPGSGLWKAGFAGDDIHSCMFPTITGTLKNAPEKPLPQNVPRKDLYISDEVQLHREWLSLTYPIERGIVTNWDHMEMLMHHTLYDELKITKEDGYGVFIAEPPLNPSANKEKLTEMMFEKFDVPSMFVANTGYLCNLASGRGSCIIVDIGEGVTQIVPFYEGKMIVAAIHRWDYGGRDITQNLSDLLLRKGYSFSTPTEMDLVREMKESVSFVLNTSDVDSTFDRAGHIEYKLPSGESITLNEERFLCAEPFFAPCLIGQDDTLGIHQRVYNSLMKCDMDLRPDLFTSIIISGGTSLMPGMKGRLLSELKTLINRNMKVNVVAHQERRYSVWIGGSILGSLSWFPGRAIHKAEYEESGPSVVHRKSDRA